MFDDPAVRSVRVALALCERFQELLKGPTTVTSSKQRGALVGVGGDQEGLSMRIGEAQQLYPEIWQHLDEARKVFAERGIDTSAFDRIRETEGQALGASVDLQTHSYGYGSRGVDQQVKSAGFNTQGLGRARQAAKALMDATPDIDWAAIAKAESADPAAADFLRGQRNKRFMRLGALALVIASPFLIVMYMRHQKRVKREEAREQWEAQNPAPPPLADDDRKAITKLVADLKPKLAAAQKTWPQVTAHTALLAIKPGTGACAQAGQLPTDAAMDAYVTAGDIDASFVQSDFFGYMADKPIADEPVSTPLRTVDAIRRRLDQGTATAYDRKALEEIRPYFRIVVIDKEVAPEITGATFVPGQVTGRAYVYSIDDARIICAGAIEAKNLDEKASPYAKSLTTDNAKQLLHREMEIRIRQSLVAGLHML